MPDSSLMLDLCAKLNISVNELLCGEVIEMTNYNEKAEQQLIEMTKEKEQRNRELLNIEIFIGILVTIILLRWNIYAIHKLLQVASWQNCFSRR